VVHDWHESVQWQSDKQYPSAARAKAAITAGAISTASTTGAFVMTGAFVGIPRSAADKGVPVTVMANKPAIPTAKIRRMVSPSINRQHNTQTLPHGEAAP
jgi:hypothetical protein